MCLGVRLIPVYRDVAAVRVFISTALDLSQIEYSTKDEKGKRQDSKREGRVLEKGGSIKHSQLLATTWIMVPLPAKERQQKTTGLDCEPKTNPLNLLDKCVTCLPAACTGAPTRFSSWPCSLRQTQELSLLPVLTDPAACAAVTGAFLPGPVHQAWKSSSSHHISQHMVSL